MQSLKWTENHVDIVYRCACNVVHLEVYKSGQVSMSAEPLNDSLEKRLPTVNVTWDDGGVIIETKCTCNTGCHFTRKSGGSGVFQIIP